MRGSRWEGGGRQFGGVLVLKGSLGEGKKFRRRRQWSEGINQQGGKFEGDNLRRKVWRGSAGRDWIVRRGLSPEEECLDAMQSSEGDNSKGVTMLGGETDRPRAAEQGSDSSRMRESIEGLAAFQNVMPFFVK